MTQTLHLSEFFAANRRKCIIACNVRSHTTHQPFSIIAIDIISAVAKSRALALTLAIGAERRKGIRGIGIIDSVWPGS